ncbi:MAG TPA: hypothetical protein DEO86_12690 [Colwellia sp.]|jgi:hypothetical protein|nr:hypothetical protein [Colwellia sp.]|tara:strand:- start:143 stop:1027 length:885 start_codon:yes stop_codon:yes gene_type:complete
MLSKSRNLRKLRCNYWTFCELGFQEFNRQGEADIGENFSQIIKEIEDLQPLNIPIDVAPDVPRNSLNQLEWIKTVTEERYKEIISPDVHLSWLSSLDQRGLLWVYNELQGKQKEAVTLDLRMTEDLVIRELDYYLYTNNSVISDKKLFIQELRNSWEEYLHKADKFEWLSSEYFDVYSWAYNYLKQSGYESAWHLAPNASQYKEFIVLAYDQIRCQHKGQLLQKGFIKEIRSAFRVQKNRKEKVAKNLMSRSYDFSEDTIKKIDKLSDKLKMTKSSIIVEAIELIYLKHTEVDK